MKTKENQYTPYEEMIEDINFFKKAEEILSEK